MCEAPFPTLYIISLASQYVCVQLFMLLSQLNTNMVIFVTVIGEHFLVFLLVFVVFIQDGKDCGTQFNRVYLRYILWRFSQQCFEPFRNKCTSDSTGKLTSDHILMGAGFPSIRRKERREEKNREENVVMAQILILMVIKGKFED